MRTFQCAVALAVWFGAMAAQAADVEFECDEAMFQHSAPLTKEVKHRFAIEERSNLDSPLYDGLWPMTLEAFRGNSESLRVEVKMSFPVPAIPRQHPTIERPQSLPAEMVIASNDDLCRFRTNYALPCYDSPLFDGLSPMTIEAFRQGDVPKDKEIFTFNIAFNR